MARRTGRRPGKQDTREAILAAARETFAEHGYDGASIRQIATSAGVDPALVHHYFGTKEELFLATVRPPVNPAEVLSDVFADREVDRLGERVLEAFLSLWEHPVSGPAFEALVRSAVVNKLSAKLVRELFTTQVVRKITREMSDILDPADIPLRASLVASQLFGLAVTRYILKLEPLADTPRATVVAAVAPNIQRYLTGEVTGVDPVR